MKCPICQNEMIKGKVQARGGAGLYWLPEDQKMGIVVSDKKILQKDGVVLVSTDTIGIVSTSSFVCKACKKIIIEYKGENSDR